MATTTCDLRCNHWRESSSRCRLPATCLLIAPDGKAVPGGYYCEYHGDGIVAEYDLKYRDKASDFIRRTRPKQRDCYACREWNYKWFANDLEEYLQE